MAPRKKPGIERRAFERVPHNTRAVLSTGRGELVADVLDVSVGGIGMEVSGPVHSGEFVRVRLPLRPTEDAEWIDPDALVVRAAPNPATGKNSVGLSFFGLPPVTLQLIADRVSASLDASADGPPTPVALGPTPAATDTPAKAPPARLAARTPVRHPPTPRETPAARATPAPRPARTGTQEAPRVRPPTTRELAAQRPTPKETPRPTPKESRRPTPRNTPRPTPRETLRPAPNESPAQPSPHDSATRPPIPRPVETEPKPSGFVSVLTNFFRRRAAPATPATPPETPAPSPKPKPRLEVERPRPVAPTVTKNELRDLFRSALETVAEDERAEKAKQKKSKKRS